MYHSVSASSSHADSSSLWCLLWVVHPQPAAVRGAAAPPLTRPLCPDTFTPTCLPSTMLQAPLSMKPPLLLLCHPHLPPLLLLHHLRRLCPRTTTLGRSVVCAAFSGNRSRRRRCAGSPTSGRWRCDSSSTRSTFALWRSCSGSRRRRRPAFEGWPPALGRQLVCHDPAHSRRAVRMRWAS